MAVTSSSPPQSHLSGIQRGDQAFRWIVRVASLLVVLLLVGLFLVLATRSTESFQRFGLSFLTNTGWDPPNESFGAFSFIYGTIVTSIIALVIATPFSMGAALFVSEYAPRWLGNPIAFLIELL